MVSQREWARHLYRNQDDVTARLFEKYGMPFYRTPDGWYLLSEKSAHELMRRFPRTVRWRRRLWAATGWPVYKLWFDQ